MQNTPHEIESPCVRNCCLNEDNVCLGCFRTVTEIMEWGPASDEERRTVLVKAMRRRHFYRAERLRAQGSSWLLPSCWPAGERPGA